MGFGSRVPSDLRVDRSESGSVHSSTVLTLTLFTPEDKRATSSVKEVVFHPLSVVGMGRGKRVVPRSGDDSRMESTSSRVRQRLFPSDRSSQNPESDGREKEVLNK